MTVSWQKIGRIGLVVGAALWLWLVWRAGPLRLWHYLVQTGAWMLLLMGIEGVRLALRGVAGRWAMGEDRAQVRLWSVCRVMVVSQAIQFVAFAGSALGESTKALLFSRRVSGARALSSVVLDVVLYQFSAGLFVLVGIAVVARALPAGAEVRNWLWVVGGVVTSLLVLVGVGFARQWRTTLGWMARLGRSGRALGRVRDWLEAQQLAGAGEQVARFHARHTRWFYGILLLDMLTHGVGAFELWVVMQVLGWPASLAAAVGVAAAGKVLRSTGHLVPGSIGFFEGGIGLVAKAMGSTLALGTAVALVIQLRSILWAGIGFLLLPGLVGRER